MNKSAINARLLSAAELTRQDATFADIGTDHAYLPLFLLESGRIKSAVCSDINEGPLASAKKNAEERGMMDKMSFILTDGATVLSGLGVTDYAICGMGGELIAAILESAPWVNREGRRLILQPMTHAEKLRAYLLSSGFAIVGETLSREGDRLYQTICAEPAPKNTLPVLTPAELAVGQALYRKGCPEQTEIYTELIDRALRAEIYARDARRGAGQETFEQDELIASLTALKEGL